MSNAQNIIDKLADHLLGEGWYIADSVGVDQANEFIYEEICRRYEAVDESPINRWRRRHPRCKWCHYCKSVTENGVTAAIPAISTCLAKDISVAVDAPKPFCGAFVLEPYPEQNLIQK